MKILELPFNQHVGLTLTQHEGQEVVCLEPEQHHYNHLGTIHARALYSLAEAASGHALLNRIELRRDETFAVLRSANVKYRRPAHDRLIALASIAANASAMVTRQLEAKGRAFIDVQVRVVSGESEDVFAGDFSWFVSRTEKP
ncbi:MAG: hypothetical protein CMJ64_07980 [Planctomycetaceae bacterium]|nr:hypothetical protein [Planctomycetaceae bacterium]